jgi:copper chaperone CopZ
LSTVHTLDESRIFFHISDMTCGRSADAVMDALRKLDDRATVRIDLPMRRVEIEPKRAKPPEFKDAISRAGYASIRQWPSDQSGRTCEEDNVR